MKLQDEYTLNAAIEEVWEHLLDEGSLAGLIPGCKKLVKSAPGEYEAVIPVKLLLFKSDFSVRLKILEEDRPNFCRFHCRIEGSLGGGEVEGSVRLKDLEGKTLLGYEADIALSSGLGKMGGRIIESSGKDKIRQGLEKLESKIYASH